MVDSPAGPDVGNRCREAGCRNSSSVESSTSILDFLGWKMNGKFLFTCVLCIASLSLCSAADSQQNGSAKILVGPDMLVSRDGEFPHVELMVASNPRNPKNLLGAAITMTKPGGGTACRTYASVDGGNKWVESSFPDQIEWGGADPQVAFGAHGTAYFAGLSLQKDEQGDSGAVLSVYRSEDGGITWEKPANLGSSYDHEQIAVDYSHGKYAGRVYIGALYGRFPAYIVGVFRSDDDGRTFTGPVDAADGGGTLGINGENLLVLSDGTLFVPYADFEYKEENRKKNRPSSMWFVTSTDGGVSFTQPRKIGEQRFTLDEDAMRTVGGGFPVFAVDNRGKTYGDRLYVAWNDFRFGKSRILFSLSADRGMTWTKPRLLDPTVPVSAVQYQPVLGVNSQGIVGATWFDTRNSPDGSKYDEYFSASMDGGSTFLPPVRVSSESSVPSSAGNLALTAMAWSSNPQPDLKGPHRISLISAGSRWSNGGDYMGLTADSAGIFRPFWADSRTGTFQVRTASIRVELPAPNADKEAHPKTGQKAEIPKVKSDISDQIEFVFDTTRFDMSTKELEVPVRLRNKSRHTIYGPITVRIDGFGSGMGDLLQEFSPAIMNATNGKPKDGAVFEYSQALGTDGQLVPSGVSGALTWKLRLVDPTRVPDLHVSVEGFLSAQELNRSAPAD